MTPNLASAKQAIQAELTHARQGIAFYSARVEALETALEQLDSVDSEDTASQGKGKGKTSARKKMQAHEGRRGAKARGDAGRASTNGSSSTTRQQGKRTRKASAARRSSDAENLPTTGADFWLELVTEEPRSAVDIANAAASRLGLAPDKKAQIQKLKQRVSPALAGLVSAQKIRNSGAGRARRFFKAEAA